MTILTEKSREGSRGATCSGCCAEGSLEDSGIDLGHIDKTRLAVIIGSGSGGLLSGEQFKKRLYHNHHPKPSLLASFTSSSFTDYIRVSDRFHAGSRYHLYCLLLKQHCHRHGQERSSEKGLPTW